MVKHIASESYTITKKEYCKRCPSIKTEINWYDLPSNKLIQLDNGFQKKIMNNWKKLPYGFKKKKAKIIGLTYAQINLLSKLKSNFTVGSLKRLTDTEKISYDTLNSYISGFGRRRVIYSPKFPFRMSSHEGIGFRSIINSEGHISKQIGRSVMVRVPERQMLKDVITFSKTIFGDFSVEIKKTKDKNTYEVFLPGEIGDILVISGLTRGRKSLKNPFVPIDVMNGSLDKKRTYLQWSFAGEMECSNKIIKLTRNVNVSHLLSDVYKRNLKFGANFKNNMPADILKNLSNHPPWLLIGEALLLEDFGINRKPYLRSLWKHKNGEVSAAWAITITNKKEMGILLHHIGLPLFEKRTKVKQTLLSYVR